MDQDMTHTFLQFFTASPPTESLTPTWPMSWLKVQVSCMAALQNANELHGSSGQLQLHGSSLLFQLQSSPNPDPAWQLQKHLRVMTRRGCPAD